MAIGPYTGTVRSIVPATNNDNWILSGGAGEVGRIMRVGASGEAAAQTPMCTRFARAASQAGALTAGNVAKGSTGMPTNTLSFGTEFATTQPTLDAGDLWADSWNAFGGILRWEARDVDDGWVIIGAATETLIVSRNSVGTGTSTYSMTWQEF